MQTCKGCRYMAPGPIDPKNLLAKTFHCYRFPPTGNAQLLADGAVANLTTYPVVSDVMHACAEYAPALEGMQS